MHLNTHRIIVATALGILLSSYAGAGQPSAKVAKVGVLRLGQGSPAVFEAFRGGLHALGYIEGETLTFVIREAVGQEAALPKLAAELVQLQVDVIFAGGDAAVRAAKQATRTIPIVMLVSGDPVSSGLVASLNQPGGNVTGVTGLSPRLTARRLEILKQAVPTLSHVAVLFNPDDETKTVDRQQLQATARALGFRLPGMFCSTIARVTVSPTTAASCSWDTALAPTAARPVWRLMRTFSASTPALSRAPCTLASCSCRPRAARTARWA